MDGKAVRIPHQKRSIEKKDRIVEAAFRIFTEKGYFGVNTAEIAKEAGLSTGSIYAYFKDKKDILMACLAKFGEDLTREICGEIGKVTVAGEVLNREAVFAAAKNVLRLLVKFHSPHRLYHDEIMSLRYRDEDVRNYFIDTERTMMAAVVAQLRKSGIAFKREREQTFLLFKMLDAVEDELSYELTPDIDNEILLDECARIAVSMLEPVNE